MLQCHFILDQSTNPCYFCYDSPTCVLRKTMWALWGKMGIDITGQHGMFTLLANNDLEL
jgi:hypothetical protein